MISVALFQTIQEWHGGGVEKREIARRLKVDVKTVRRMIRKIEAGALAPARSSPGSKLDPYAERIIELAASGRTAWNVHLALHEDPAFTASYELVKKRVARLRRRDPRVYERLEHRPGAEMQADFGELARVQHQGRLVRVWAYVAVWPYSRYRYAEVVLEQSVPTFLSAMQNGIVAATAIPERISVDNLAAAVLREHFHERGYQREFSAFCKHFGTLPNAVRPRTPTDKGAVENGVGVLKRALRGRSFATLDDLQKAVSTTINELNDRPSALDHRRPNDLIVHERRGDVPERFPIGATIQYLASQLNAAMADLSVERLVERYVHADLIILDELGFTPLNRVVADHLFRVVSERYERGSMIVTSNKPFEQWAEMFVDPILANAALDRLIWKRQCGFEPVAAM